MESCFSLKYRERERGRAREKERGEWTRSWRLGKGGKQTEKGGMEEGQEETYSRGRNETDEKGGKCKAKTQPAVLKRECVKESVTVSGEREKAH